MKHFVTRKRIRLPHPVYKEGHAFFLTIGTFQRYSWFGLYPELADLSVDLLRNIGADRETTLYAWCVMPDHIHLLLQDKNIIDFVRLFKGRMTPKAFSKEPGRRLWQRTFYDHALRKEESLTSISLYIWENPLRSELVADPTLYQWSGSEIWPFWRELYGRG